MLLRPLAALRSAFEPLSKSNSDAALGSARDLPYIYQVAACLSGFRQVVIRVPRTWAGRFNVPDVDDCWIGQGVKQPVN